MQFVPLQILLIVLCVWAGQHIATDLPNGIIYYQRF
jgi:hypothetical protein